jgi:hypothetical protein
MSLDNTARLYLEGQVALARVAAAALSLMAFVESSGAPVRRLSLVFLSAYLLLALAAALAERFSAHSRLQIPLPLDIAVLAAVLYLVPSVLAFGFLFVFGVFALATRGNKRGMLVLVALATVAIMFRVAMQEHFRPQSIGEWIAVGFGTLVSGLCIGFLGGREREHFKRQQLLEKIMTLNEFSSGKFCQMTASSAAPKRFLSHAWIHSSSTRWKSQWGGNLGKPAAPGLAGTAAPALDSGPCRRPRHRPAKNSERGPC